MNVWYKEHNSVCYTDDPLICSVTGMQISKGIHIKDNSGNDMGVFGYDVFQDICYKLFADNEFIQIRGIISNAPFGTKARKIQRGLMTPKLRYKILKRDKFRCVYCGRTAKETRLHIDHIIPISQGGSTMDANLQVLCRRYNLGKHTDNG